MVMDSQPSPQSVGREFVRQYYTLLNKAPSHLHRFYNNNSSFIHGGLDNHNREAVLVIGQKNIHNKIQQLNFRDCHAKISQVDAQSTLGSGVVVQVTGELSNDGQPMRRFTQTFVLAAQSPKNYYVHNDIFRYQDLYSDDENEQIMEQNNDESEIGSSPTTPVENNKMVNSELIVNTTPTPGVITNATTGQQPLYYAIQPSSLPAVQGQNIINTGLQVAAVAIPVAIQPQLNGVANNTPVNDEIMQTIQQTATSQITAAAPPAAAPAVAVSSTLDSPTASTPTTPATTPVLSSVNVATTVLVQSTPAVQAQTQTASSDLDSSKTSNDSIIDVVEKNNKEEVKVIEQPVEKIEPVKNTANEPKTYANLLKSSSGVSSGLSLAGGFVPLPPASNQINSYSRLESNQQNSSNQSSASLPQRQNSARQNKDYSDSVRRTSNTNSYGDANQLFLGNVPHIATEEDLRSVFSKFGAVADLRLHSKAGTKAPGARNTPNYGFITYEDPEAVQKCLANTPIFYPDAEGQKLNVEEKKPRLRQDMPNHRPISNNGNLGGSQRSGGGGGGGQNRSLSNSGSGGLMRNSSGGPRSGTGNFNRSNDNRGGQQRQQNSSGSGGGGGGGGYNRR